MIVQTGSMEKNRKSEWISEEAKSASQDAFFGCSGFTARLEAVTKEERSRLQGTLKRFSDLPDSGEREPSAVRKALEAYFETLVFFLRTAIKNSALALEDASVYQDIVEGLYLLYCVRDRRSNSYEIYGKHPVVLMNELLNAEAEAIADRATGGTESDTEDAREWQMLRDILATKKENRRRMKLFCRSQVYEVADRNGTLPFKAIPFRQNPAPTAIPYIRIWEKLASYRKKHPELQCISVAVFGELADTEGYDARRLLEKLLDVQIVWRNFYPNPALGNYYFEDTHGQVYDLSNQMDLKDLKEECGVILFLDLNCFYRQRQSLKDVREQREEVNCTWYLDRSREASQFKDKAAYYQKIYGHVGLWLNSLEDERSSSFEFDEKLYYNLKMAADADTDIYLYIKYGSRIASDNLDYSGVCDDEYYDGCQLTVCKLTRPDESSLNENYRKFLEKSIDVNDFYVKVKFWKLLKSISNRFCDSIIEEAGCREGLAPDKIIDIFNTSYLVLRYQIEGDKREISIRYQTQLREGISPYLQKLIRHIMEIMMEYVCSKDKMYCVRKYFKGLLIHSVISNAGDVGDLVFAHLLSMPWMKLTCSPEKGNTEEYSDSIQDISHESRIKKTIYALIEQLEDLRMRDMPDMRGYFLGPFRKVACPEIHDDNIVDTFHLIRRSCEHYRHTGSSLYVNSGLIDY